MEVSVCVVGGGIGGLTAALSLFRRGFDVQVYEQAAALGEVGAGVQVSPNASRVLHRLGLAEELATTGVKPVAWHQRRWDDGRTLLRSPLAEPLEATFGFPHYQMHRADLLAALAGALPAERVYLGHRLTGLTDRGDRVEARFANGASVEAAGSTDWSFDAVAWLYNHDATVVDPLPDLAATQPKPASSPGS
ncbi:MAG TPA: FAD-dependent monooxygenase [Streptosporangiaceae bacterium]|nr:FAD-dependent monooxygenase [Streptosporangiaceae bacterium]